ncbi:MAG: phosphoribosylformylglycinamidine cyclo-ligase [Chloroflexi bacterium]|nr:phosphoribosylformylglycinamidine cyclo-ligase [Chloroflexota bacterium]
MSSYREAGVDISRAEDALSRVRERVARTKRPEVIGGIGAFGGLFRFGGMKDGVLVATTDGVGTKLELARLLDRHEVVGADLVNHCVNDALAMGADPLFFLDYFSTSQLDPAIFARVVGAMADACATHGCALLGGETAEMPGMYGAGSYDLAGFLVGAVERDRLLDPASVRAGDALIGIPSSGLHTNGYSLARHIVSRLAEREGRTVEEALKLPRPALGATAAVAGSAPGAAGASPGRATTAVTLGDALLVPHRCYLTEVRAMRAVAELRSLAHLTGGGWEGNLPRALPDGLGAFVRRDAWTVPPLFTVLGDAGTVPDADRFDTWNMGIGLIAVVAPADADRAALAVAGAVHLGTVERARPGERRVRFV